MSRQISFLLIFSACAFQCLALETTAALQGMVTDPSEAVVANVTVRVTNLAMNTTLETKGDAAGSYSIPFLPTGDYALTAALGGFQSQKVDRITLQVQQAARVDFQLKVGDVNESVEVSATAAALQTENATVGTVIDSSKIVDLPRTAAILSSSRS